MVLLWLLLVRGTVDYAVVFTFCRSIPSNRMEERFSFHCDLSFHAISSNTANVLGCQQGGLVPNKTNFDLLEGCINELTRSSKRYVLKRTHHTQLFRLYSTQLFKL
jgi:hypothetical protein